MKASKSPLPAAGDSLCYGCHHYDWAIVLGKIGAAAWEHICNGPSGRTAGDGVVECIDFRKAVK